jgi:hypothetical protein
MKHLNGDYYGIISWWAYRHINGAILVKRYFDERDIEEALESPFVDEVIGPFHADNAEQARAWAKLKLSRG